MYNTSHTRVPAGRGLNVPMHRMTWRACGAYVYPIWKLYTSIAIRYLSAVRLHIGCTTSATQLTAHDLNTQLNVQFIKSVDIMRILG